jgi:CDP-diglyceride synthetase
LLKLRVLAALVFAPPLLVLVWYGRAPLTVACFVIALLMLWEFYRLTLGVGELYLKTLGFGLGGAVALATLGLLSPTAAAVGDSRPSVPAVTAEPSRKPSVLR